MPKILAVNISATLDGVASVSAVGNVGVTEGDDVLKARGVGSLTVFAIFTPDEHFVVKGRKVKDGEVITATTTAFEAVLKSLGRNWDLIHELTPRQFEELIAAAYKEDGAWDNVILTPASGDLGRDVIVEKKGFGALKIVNSAKRFQRDGIVSYDDIRTLAGVLAMDTSISKGVVSTSGKFPPNVKKDRLLKPLIPTRLELLSGADMQMWIKRIEEKKKT